jgi:cytidylate kinase
MIITIDGPVASGKSTVARSLAKRLGYLYLNTGLMFRAAAYLLYVKDVSLNLSDLRYRYTPDAGAQMFYKESNITPLLKTAEMDQLASQAATLPEVRKALLLYQQKLAQENNVIAEGRDTGTVVFPQANYKFFITARPEVRAERWRKFQSSNGKDYDVEVSLESIKERDLRDTERQIAPLCIPEDAQVIDTSDMTVEQVVEACLEIIHNKGL